jgi:hypothetical protein
MSVSALVRVLAVASVATTLAMPSELLPPEPSDGWELISRDPADDPTDLTFDEYAEIEPDSVAHIDPESDEAAGFTATVEVWSRGDEFLVTEIVRTPDNDAANSFVDQAAANSIESGLAAADPPFAGAWSYSGPDEDSWTRVVSWAQGPYGVTLTHLSATESDSATIAGLTSQQITRIADITGFTPGDEPAPGGPSTAGPTSSDDGAGGIPIGKVVLWLAAIIGAIWVAVKLKRMLSETTAPQQPEPKSADDIIAEARRSRVPPADRPTGDPDDIVERARREAQAEVDELDSDRTPPHDG